jgi:transketolase|tara:strand:- start:2 stop:478 length:477 start_codon:yes stop_codon:yes gene_type:complete
MRKDFSNLLYDEMSSNPDIVLITGDLGYGLWDKIRIDFSDRFYNVGSSEQLMLGIATGFAMEGKIPVVYSITPFLLYRPFELIRNYLDHEKIPVKLVGGGRNRDYGYLGFSHWAEDDKKIMACFKNIKTSHPKNTINLNKIFKKFIYDEKPAYLNLKR